jgi:hypothetical protein
MGVKILESGSVASSQKFGRLVMLTAESGKYFRLNIVNINSHFTYQQLLLH